MPAKRLSMHQIIEVLRLKHAAHLSHRQIARALKISIGTITNYLSSAQRAGLSWPLPDGVDDAALNKLLWQEAKPTVPDPQQRVQPDFVNIHEELKRKGVTRQLLWEEYRQRHPENGYGYTQFVCTTTSGVFI